MEQQKILFRISQLLSRFTEQVKILNSNAEFSINIHAENILIDVLNVIFDCELKNVNYKVNKIYPSIDLRDNNKRIAIQVTSSSNLNKIKHTLSEFIANELYKDFDTLYIYIITEKQTSYKQESIDDIIKNQFVFPIEHIIDKKDLYLKLNAMNDIHKIKKVCQLLENQFADNNERNKWNLYCSGLDEYDQYIINLYSYLDIKGFSPRINNTIVRLNLDKIYVPLKFKFDFSNNDDKISSREKMKSYDIVTALEYYDRIVVLGDPGSGKSTSLKYLAYTICLRRTDNNWLQSYIPVLIKATDYAKYNANTGKSLSEYIIDINAKYGLLFSKCLDKNELIVLIDGLDEINITSQRHLVVDKINSFTAQYPAMKFIVSSRIVGYKETRLSCRFFHFEVEKLSDNQIFSFLNNWYSSISSYSDNNLEKAFEDANSLFLSIKKNSSVYKLACNPLLITIIALINFQGNKLPEKRASLYEISTATLLDNWVKLRANHRNNIDREILIELLAIIAFHIHESDSSGLIPEKELKEILRREYSKIYPYLPLKELKQDIQDIINFLREDAGFLFEKGFNENGEALFGFFHLTFQEYYAAIEFCTKWKEGGMKDNFKSYIYNSSWTEVIKLAASLFRINEPTREGRKTTTKFVADILKTEVILPETAHNLYLVCQILKDDVEIEFDSLKAIIDDLFKRLKEDKSIDYPSLDIYERCFCSILQSTCYQDYLLKRITETIQINTIPNLSKRLIHMLMDISDSPKVYGYLLSVLQSNIMDNKVYMFEWRTVFPVADIVRTEQFRTEIVKYVNSLDYSKIYNGNLPIQYTCCFDESIDDWLFSIDSLNDDRMKKDLIDFYVFSWGISDVDNLKQYYEVVRSKYPRFDLSRIENYLAKLERYNSFGLKKYPILILDDVEIYEIKDKVSSYAMKHNEEIKVVYKIFESKLFEPYLGKKAKSFVQFCNMVITACNSVSKEILIQNKEEMDLLIEYCCTIHWAANIQLNEAKFYALSHLFVGEEADEKLLRWLKNDLFKPYKPIIFVKSFNKSTFEDQVKSSSLDIFDKIALLKIVNPQFKDNDLLFTAIEEYNKIDSSEKKEECKAIIHSIM